MKSLVITGLVVLGFLFLFFFIGRVLLPYIRLQYFLIKYLKTRKIEELFQRNWSFWPEMDALVHDIKAIMDEHVKDSYQLKRKQAEFLALQNQINPHFLYNALEAIRGDAIVEGMKKIADTTRALAIFFRYTITEVENLVRLEDEIDNAENYFIIQKYRFGNKLNMFMEIPDGNYELLQALLPKLTLQPIIENAIYHGLERKLGGGEVRIIIENTVTNLIIRIKDNGIGIPHNQLIELNQVFKNEKKAHAGSEEEKSRKGGIALPNVNNRIKLLFGEDYGLHIYSGETVGTEVKIVVPLQFERAYK
ncbi:histidine kinase [Lachnospiraceae bacterium 54-53]